MTNKTNKTLPLDPFAEGGIRGFGEQLRRGEITSEKAIGNVQFSSASSFARPDSSSFKVSPDCLPSIVKRGIRTSPVEMKNAPSRNDLRTGAHPSSNRGIRSRRK